MISISLISLLGHIEQLLVVHILKDFHQIVLPISGRQIIQNNRR